MWPEPTREQVSWSKCMQMTTWESCGIYAFMHHNFTNTVRKTRLSRFFYA